MPKKNNSQGSPAKLKVHVKQPDTAEDLIVRALEKGSLDEVVKILRDFVRLQRS